MSSSKQVRPAAGGDDRAHLIAPPAPSVSPGPAGKNSVHLSLDSLGLQRNGRWLFRRLTWEVPRGGIIAVVGPSGAGKSSLLACLAGQLAPTEGTVRCHLAGGPCPPAACTPRIGVVFQHFALSPNSTLLTNILCGRLARHPWWRTLAGFPRTDKLRAWTLLCDLGLGPLAHRRAGEVSGGEQQRTALLRALFQEPDFLLADEPVSQLDTYLAGRVLGLLSQEARDKQRTVLCVLHDPSLVDRFADHVLSLDPQRPEGWKIRHLRHD